MDRTRLIRRIPRLLILLCFIAYAFQTVAQHCGVERWAVKTGTDHNAQQVDLSIPKDTTIADLIALSPPNPIPKVTRVAPTETTVFVVSATLTDYKLEGGSRGDSDYHLVLRDDQGRTMVAEIPSPTCVGTGSPFASQIASARAAFDSQLTAGPSFQTANIPVKVTGVGFFDFPHGQHGAAPNVIELHPVLDIVFNPSAGSDFAILVPSSTINLPQGGSATIAISTSSITGPVPDVTFSTSGLPAGVTDHFTSTAKGKSTLSLTASTAAPTGVSPFTLTGTTNGKSHSQILSVNVTGSSQTPNNQEWEYQVINASSEQDVITQANQLGQQDWEMVSVVKVTGTPAWRAFFRRVKHF